MKRAFTFVEILVSVAILSILIAGIYGILNIGRMSYNEDMGLVELQQRARLAMDGMITELRGAKISSVKIDPDGEGIVFNLPTATGIKYYLDVDDNNGDGIKNQIIREYPSGTTYKILANDINSLNFSRSGNIVEIQLAAKKSKKPATRELCFPAPCESPPKTLKEKVRLRNE